MNQLSKNKNKNTKNHKELIQSSIHALGVLGFYILYGYGVVYIAKIVSRVIGGLTMLLSAKGVRELKRSLKRSQTAYLSGKTSPKHFKKELLALIGVLTWGLYEYSLPNKSIQNTVEANENGNKFYDPNNIIV